jgi:hypothetical protein
MDTSASVNGREPYSNYRVITCTLTIEVANLRLELLRIGEERGYDGQ